MPSQFILSQTKELTIQIDGLMKNAKRLQDTFIDAFGNLDTFRTFLRVDAEKQEYKLPVTWLGSSIRSEILFWHNYYVNETPATTQPVKR